MDRAEERDAPLGSVDGPDDDPVTAVQALVVQDAGHAGDEPSEVAVAGDPGPEAGPDQQERTSIEPLDGFADEVENRVHRPSGHATGPAGTLRARAASAAEAPSRMGW